MNKMSSNNVEDHTMKDPLAILENIHRVDAPPFLLTRVMQKINDVKTEQIPTRFVWSLGISFLIVLALNVSVITSRNKHQQVNNIATEMNLYSSNSLYK